MTKRTFDIRKDREAAELCRFRALGSCTLLADENLVKGSKILYDVRFLPIC